MKLYKSRWSLENKKVLMNLLKDGYQIKKIAEMWENLDDDRFRFSYGQILREVRNGLTEKELLNKQFARYSVLQSYKNDIGEEAYNYIIVEANKENYEK